MGAADGSIVGLGVGCDVGLEVENGEGNCDGTDVGQHLVCLLVTPSVMHSAELLESKKAWLLAMLSATIMVSLTVDLLGIMMEMSFAMEMEMRLAYYLD